MGTDYKAPARSPGLDALAKTWMSADYGRNELATTTKAAVDNALPSFLSDLGGLKEQNIRRGISTGDLGTSNEGDLYSAFQRNLANSVAAQSLGLFNNRNSLLAGYFGDQLDREQAAQNAHQQAKSGFLSGLMGLGGAALGFFAGGPVGAAAGAKIGSGAG